MNVWKLGTIFVLTIAMTLAATSAAWANNTGQVGISYIKVDESGIVALLPSGEYATDNAQCDGDNQASSVAILSSRDEYPELLSTLLMAHANNRQVAFWLDGTCTTITGGTSRPSAQMIYVYSN